MKVLLDTDVVLDIVLDRAPFADAASAIWVTHEQHRISAFIAPITPINAQSRCVQELPQSAIRPW